MTLSIGPAPREPREPNRRRGEGGRNESDYPRTRPARTSPPEPPVGASRRSQRALDWFTFFVADVQTGFGPFISVYLTTHQWTQVDIGLVLTAGGLAALAFQMPGGLLLDAVRSERRVAALAMIGISASALLLALWPIFPAVLGAQILHAAASCVLNPAIAAISL